MKKVDVLPGTRLDNVVHTLLEANAKGESAYCKFNGYLLYSDTVSMDSAYMKVLGRTKADLDKASEEFLKEKPIEKENIPLALKTSGPKL